MVVSTKCLTTVPGHCTTCITVLVLKSSGGSKHSILGGGGGHAMRLNAKGTFSSFGKEGNVLFNDVWEFWRAEINI